jgi:hypothetical protein
MFGIPNTHYHKLLFCINNLYFIFNKIKMNTYKLFDTNLLKCNEYNEIYKFYNKNQKASELISQIYKKQFDPKIISKFLSMINKRDECKTIVNSDTKYNLQVECFEDLQMVIITEVITKQQITFVKEHVIY